MYLQQDSVEQKFNDTQDDLSRSPFEISADKQPNLNETYEIRESPQVELYVRLGSLAIYVITLCN